MQCANTAMRINAAKRSTCGKQTTRCCTADYPQGGVGALQVLFHARAAMQIDAAVCNTCRYVSRKELCVLTNSASLRTPRVDLT